MQHFENEKTYDFGTIKTTVPIVPECPKPKFLKKHQKQPKFETFLLLLPHFFEKRPDFARKKSLSQLTIDIDTGGKTSHIRKIVPFTTFARYAGIPAERRKRRFASPERSR